MKIPELNKKYKPLAGRILIRPIDNTKDDRMRGSIELSEDALPTQHAMVVGVGRGEVAPQTGTVVPMELNEGDIVLIRKGMAYLPVRQDNEDLMLVRESDVEAVVF